MERTPAALLLLAMMFASGESEKCVAQENPCKCSLADGRSLDLTPLTFVSSFKDFDGPYGNFRYAWGPCNHVLDKLAGYCNPENDSAVCQAGRNSQASWFNLGKAATATFDVDTSANPIVTLLNYTGGTPGGPREEERRSYFRLICDHDLDPGTIEENNHDLDKLKYYFTVRSKYACLMSGAACPLADAANPCVCRMKDNRFINLTALKESFQKFYGDDGRLYAWGPCGESLDIGEYCVHTTDPAMCQGEDGHWYSLGRASTATFSVDELSDPVTTTLRYSGGTEGRSSVIKLICDDQIREPGRISELYEEPANVYNFAVASPHACPQSPNHS